MPSKFMLGLNIYEKIVSLLSVNITISDFATLVSFG